MKKLDFLGIFKKFMSFATIGALLTILSLGMSTICLKYFDTPLIPTYIVINVFIIMLSFFLNSKYTFRSEINVKNSIKYYAIYLTSMGMGSLLLKYFSVIFDFDKWVFPFLVLPFTLSFNFLMSSKFLKKPISDQLC
jgi:putative flippase GtrA